MTAVIAFFMTWWKAILGAVIGAALCFPLAQCRGERIGKERADLAIQKANVRYLEQKGRADALAAAQRITDLVAVQQNERNLRDAIALTPDTAPDAVRVQLGCARLRAAGRDTASLPTVCRTGGGAQAPAAG